MLRRAIVPLLLVLAASPAAAAERGAVLLVDPALGGASIEVDGAPAALATARDRLVDRLGTAGPALALVARTGEAGIDASLEARASASHPSATFTAAFALVENARLIERTERPLGQLARGETASAAAAFRLPDGRDPARLRVVAWIEVEDDPTGRHAPGEVVQAAAAPLDGARVEQRAKAVLLRAPAAEACEACAEAEALARDLASAFADPGGASLRTSYARAPPLPALVLAAALAGLFGWALWPRRRSA